MSQLGRFFVGCLVLFPLALALWYWAREWVTLPLRPLAAGLAGWVVPGVIEQVTAAAGTLEFVTRAHVVSVNALIYGYGLPLFIAMMVASQARGLAWKLPVGALLLMLPQAWGVAFDFLLNFATRAGNEAAAAGLIGWKREGLAFAYQMGALILPVVCPVVLWVLMNRGFVYGVLFEGAIDDKAVADIPSRTPRK